MTECAAQELFLIVIAGPNGSGKTTLKDYLQKQGYRFGHYINVDEIAKTLLLDSEEARVRKAQEIADQQRNECITKKISFSFETVMSHQSKLDFIAMARQSGFFIQLFYIGIDDPDINIGRVANRVALGGHDVPRDRIIARWKRSMILLAQAIRLSHRAYIFDNSTPLGGPKPAYVWQDGQGTIITPRWVQQYVIEPLSLANRV